MGDCSAFPLVISSFIVPPPFVFLFYLRLHYTTGKTVRQVLLVHQVQIISRPLHGPGLSACYFRAWDCKKASSIRYCSNAVNMFCASFAVFTDESRFSRLEIIALMVIMRVLCKLVIKIFLSVLKFKINMIHWKRGALSGASTRAGRSLLDGEAPCSPFFKRL